MARITIEDVLGVGYTPRPEQDINVFIDLAQTFVDGTLVVAALHTADELRKIQTLLAVYYATLSNPVVSSGSASGRSAQYAGRDENPWLKAAKALDRSGLVAKAFTEKGRRRAQLIVLTPVLAEGSVT